MVGPVIDDVRVSFYLARIYRFFSLAAVTAKDFNYPFISLLTSWTNHSQSQAIHHPEKDFQMRDNRLYNSNAP